MRGFLGLALLALGCASGPASVGPGGPESIGRVQLGPPNADAEIDRAALLEELATRRSDLQACYQEELEENPALDGHLTLALDVAGSGIVLGVRFPEDDTGAADLHECIRLRAAKWRLPPHTKKKLTVRVPLSLELRAKR